MVLRCMPAKQGPTMPAPTSFANGDYCAPEHATYATSADNAHEKDAHIEFYAEPHVYLLSCDGRRRATSTSVTGLAHEHCHPFDARVAVGLMQNGKGQAWPRREYVRDLQRVERDEDLRPWRGALLWIPDDGTKDAKRTIASLRPHHAAPTAGGHHIGELLRTMCVPSLRHRAQDALTFSFEREMTDDEIVTSWEDNGANASNQGTEAHLQMQLLAEGEPYRSDPAVDVGLAFFAQVRDGWSVYACEKEIYCADLDVAGSVDLIVRNDDTGEYAIIDHKHSEKLSTKMRGFSSASKSGRMKKPFDHLEDCDGATYALQLSIYRWILEREYGMTVVECMLFGLHPKAPFATAVPYLKAEVDYLMASRRAVLRARDECPQRCPLTDVPLHDPVFARDEGRIVSVDRKFALATGYDILRDDKGEPQADHVTRDVVARHVATRAREHAPPPFDTHTMTPWCELMPKHGIRPALFGEPATPRVTGAKRAAGA
jgi:hypothetical protein